MGNKLVFSYYTQRVLIGIIGMLLPLVLVLSSLKGQDHIQSSISDYYYTNRGDFLVAIICILGVFLFAYEGPEANVKIDSIISKLAALCGIGVAFFPTAIKQPVSKFNIHVESVWTPQVPVFGELHLLFAFLFFMLLSFMSLFLFTKTDVLKSEKTPGVKTQKDKRNVVYKICGWTMIACIVILVLYFKIERFQNWFGDFPLIFWLETVALEAFGLSWITKGEAIYPDDPHNAKTVRVNLLKTTLVCFVTITVLMWKDRAYSYRIDKGVLNGEWICANDNCGTYSFRADSMIYSIINSSHNSKLEGAWDIRDVIYANKAVNFLLLKNHRNGTIADSSYYLYKIELATDKQLSLTDLMIKDTATGEYKKYLLKRN